ncbi:MAG: hypothetical protein AB4352_05515 [Hormoscilla sp.]
MTRLVPGVTDFFPGMTQLLPGMTQSLQQGNHYSKEGLSYSRAELSPSLADLSYSLMKSIDRQGAIALATTFSVKASQGESPLEAAFCPARATFWPPGQ